MLKFILYSFVLKLKKMLLMFNKLVFQNMSLFFSATIYLRINERQKSCYINLLSWNILPRWTWGIAFPGIALLSINNHILKVLYNFNILAVTGSSHDHNICFWSTYVHEILDLREFSALFEVFHFQPWLVLKHIQVHSFVVRRFEIFDGTIRSILRNQPENFNL